MIQQADDLVRTAPLEVLDEDVPKPEQTTPGSTRTDPPWSRGEVEPAGSLSYARAGRASPRASAQSLVRSGENGQRPKKTPATRPAGKAIRTLNQ